MLPWCFSEIPRLVMIGNNCLKPFYAAVMCALVASKQPPDSPITKVLKSWHSFECVFTDMYLNGIQTVSWGFFTFTLLASNRIQTVSWWTFTFTLLASKHVFFLQCSFNSQASFMNPEVAVWQSIEFTQTPLEHTPQNHLTFVVGFWASPDEPSILVLSTFILRSRVSGYVL